MALADYRLCDVCESKAFYDSNLNYEFGGDGSNSNTPPYKTTGADQYDDADLLKKHGVRLDYLGDWAVLCADCAKTHRTQIVPIDQEQS